MRAIVERQNHFLSLKKIIGLVVLEAKTWAAGGIDFNCSGNAQRIGVRTPGCGSQHM